MTGSVAAALIIAAGEVAHMIPCGPTDPDGDSKRPHWLRSRGHGHPGSKVPWGKRVEARRKKTKAAKRHKKYLKELARQRKNRKEDQG